MLITSERVYEALAHVTHPAFNRGIIELGMIQNLVVDKMKISFDLVVEKKSDPLISSVKKACIRAIKNYISKDVEIDNNISIVYKAKEEEHKVLPDIKNIIAIASGKGGVGKSTVASNLAVTFAKMGFKTGLVDADIFGPSIPKMLGVEGERPETYQENGKDIIVPIVKYGVKLLSIGFFVSQNDALIWRGPMASNALKQLILQGDWGELDYMFIDLPPGTSDIHLTLVQEVPVTGAVIVSTPQKVAIADAIKGISMFISDKIDVPVLGLVENMAWFTPEELPENKYFIFGKDGVTNLAKEKNLSLLGQIPIVQGICDDGDNGNPSALDETSIIGKAFMQLAEKLIFEIDKRNKNQNPTKKVDIIHH